MNTNRIISTVNAVDPRNTKSITEAASVIMEEFTASFNVGDACIVIDDPTYPYPAQRGKIASQLKGAYYDVQLENGITVPLMANQLTRP